MAEQTDSAIKVTLNETYYGAAMATNLAARLGALNNFIIKNIVNYPIGSIVESDLTQAQFQAIRTTDWLLCNGQSCAGSDYNTLTGNATVPDLRARYLRGKNNGRSDGKENPDGDLALGTAQAQQLGSHTHSFTFTHNTTGSTGAHDQANGIQGYNSDPPSFALGFSITGPTNMTAPSQSDITSVSLSEVRPRSVVANFFIRVNN